MCLTHGSPGCILPEPQPFTLIHCNVINPLFCYSRLHGLVTFSLVCTVTSAVRAQVAAQCIFHGITERVVPDLATDVWMTSLGVHGNSAAAVLEDGGNGERTNSWAGLCCAHGHGAYPHQCQDQTDAAREFGHIRVIMIPPHTTSFLQPCDVGLMRPFKSTIRRTACDNYARAIYNNTDDIGIVQPTAVPDLRANLVRLIETGVRALERDRRFEFAWKHLRSFDEVWAPLLDEARQLHAAGQLFEELREKQEEVPETVAMSSRFACCRVRRRPATYDEPRHSAKNDSVFGSNCLVTNVFQNLW